jgi:hypothetical protein
MALRIARWARWILSIVLVAVIGMQFVQPSRTNSPVAPEASLLARTPPEITALLDRSCRDCHSNETRWPSYSYVAPMSFFVADHVNHGREHFNYSTWTSYTSSEQEKLLESMCDLTKHGRMPLPSYLLIHRGAKVSGADVTLLCTWSAKMRDTLQ